MFTSVDFLYLVIAFCVLIFTGFLVWVLYYIAMILKQGNEMVSEFRQRMEEIENAVRSIKEKVFTSTSSIAFVAKEISEVSRMVRDFKNRRAGKKSRRQAGAKKSEVTED